MLYVQDKIDDTLEHVLQMLNPELPEDIRKEILDEVRYLGFQWQQANAHCRVLCICAGMMQHPEVEEYDPDDETQMKKLEAEGTYALINLVGLPTYCWLITEYTEKACRKDNDKQF